MSHPLFLFIETTSTTFSCEIGFVVDWGEIVRITNTRALSLIVCFEVLSWREACRSFLALKVCRVVLHTQPLALEDIILYKLQDEVALID